MLQTGPVLSIATLFSGHKVNVDLLGKSPSALFAVIGVMAWQFTPFYMVYFIAGYGNIDTSLYEAAVIDGATRRQYLFKIAIPLLGPIFKTACTMSLIGSLKYFDMVWNMTQGGPAGGTELMATYMYKLSFQQFNMGYGSCVAAGMFILITLIALLFQKVFVVGVSMWNEFAFANTLLQTASQKTLPLALGQFKGEHSMDMPLMLSVLVISALPMVILFIIFQDKLVKGMMAGAVKG